MNTRGAALILTVVAAAATAVVGLGGAAWGLAMAGALFALAAGWLAAGRLRRGLAVAGLLLWLAAMLVAGGGWLSVACVVGLMGAVLVVVFGPGWSGWSDRYDRRGPLRPADDPRGMWDSLDRGVDPTADP